MGLDYRRAASIRHSSLGEVLLDLVCLRVSQLHDCDYCQGLHNCDLAEKGVSAQKLAAVQAWRDAGSIFDQRERAALAWAETVTRLAKKTMRGDAFDDVSALFSEREMTDLITAVGLMNTHHRYPTSA